MKFLFPSDKSISILLFLFIFLDLSSIYVIIKFRSGYQACEKQNLYYNQTLNEYRDYIKQSLILGKIDFNGFPSILMDSSLKLNIGEEACIVLASKNVCEACFSNLLEIMKSHISNLDKCFIFSEDTSNLIIEEDWIDQGFLSSNFYYKDTIFRNYLISNELVVIKIFSKNRVLPPFIFDPKIEVWEHFLHD